MKKLFVSLPMRDLTEVEILSNMHKAKEQLEHILGEEFLLIDTFIREDRPGDVPKDKTGIWCLGKSIEMMATADFVIFAPGWKNARGCRVEHETAIGYELPIYEMD